MLIQSDVAARIVQYRTWIVERVDGWDVDTARTYEGSGQCVSQYPYAASHAEDLGRLFNKKENWVAV